MALRAVSGRISLTNVTGTLPVANGGTGVTSSTGTGSVVLSASPTLTGTLTTPVVTLANSSTFSDISNGYFVFRNSGNTAGILINTTNDGTAVFRNRANTADGAIQAGAATFTAAVEVQSTTAGVRFPNMTTTQKNAIASPQAGTVVFDTTLSKLTVYSGAAWQTITSV
tara:strand:- start:1935 stop:2441 length:507 start_codon:yes stop_codon:yes gene_type:complete